uniref:Uncharacterized protein n=1 Tax=Plectus sambesii TaxID=2011161 RepID=A0A914WAI4_9BILA
MKVAWKGSVDCAPIDSRRCGIDFTSQGDGAVARAAANRVLRPPDAQRDVSVAYRTPALSPGANRRKGEHATIANWLRR